MIRLMLADDHQMLREGLRSQFGTSTDIRVVGEAGTAADLLARAPALKPDVLLLDHKLPDGTGISLLRPLRALLPRCKVIILTMYDHARYAMQAIKSGAAGYVIKGSPFEELLKAVRTVHGNEPYICAAILPKVVHQLRGETPTDSVSGLSHREFEVLVMIGQGLGIKEIAQQLNINHKTITTYRARILKKLHLSRNADLIRFALDNGLVE